MHHGFKLDDSEHSVELSRGRNAYWLHFDGVTLEVHLTDAADNRRWLSIGSQRFEVVIATRGDDVFVHFDGEAHHLRYRHPLDRLGAQSQISAEDSIRAPMPGTLVAIRVAAGEAVTRGQQLLVMESMKMETTLVAARDGLVAAVHFDKGRTFDRDALLLSLEPRATTHNLT
jgi:acetyl/propionyl-CoA carboxylase alpha subunit